MGAGHGLGLSRRDPGLPHRRAGPPHHRGDPSAWFAREVAAPLGRRLLHRPARERGRSGLAGYSSSDLWTSAPRKSRTSWPRPSSTRRSTPPMANEWWRRAEIPAANGHGNARSVAAIQSVIAGRGQARGIRLLSAEGTDAIFEEQTDGTDLVLGVPFRFGMGYGLGNADMPIGPRACFWGGYGGSVIVIDQDTDLTVCYVMNRMESGLVGDLRGMTIVLEAAQGVLA